MSEPDGVPSNRDRDEELGRLERHHRTGLGHGLLMGLLTDAESCQLIGRDYAGRVR